MRQISFHFTLCAMLLALSVPAEAQQARKMPVIGYLDYGAAIDRDEAFFEALRDLGWIEGQNIVIEYRWAEGKFDRLPALAKELVGIPSTRDVFQQPVCRSRRAYVLRRERP